MFDLKSPTIMYFYAEWCPHCKNFMPEWKKFKEQVAGQKINAVERSCVEYADYCSNVTSLEGYPSIYFIPASGTPVEYTGPRNAKELLKFYKKNV